MGPARSAADRHAARLRRQRTPLSRAVIVGQAMRIVESDGLAAVTMRRLADDLSTSPMALYRHIADRQDLLVGMLDEVAGEVNLPPAAGDPRAELTAVFTAIHDALHRHPWAVQLLVIDQLAGPKIVPAIERIMLALSRAGFGPRDSSVAYGLIWHYTVGELLDDHNVTPESYNRRMVRELDAASYPAIANVLAHAPAEPRGDFYAENLQRLLDGLLLPAARHL